MDELINGWTNGFMEEGGTDRPMGWTDVRIGWVDGCAWLFAAV